MMQRVWDAADDAISQGLTVRASAMRPRPATRLSERQADVLSALLMSDEEESYGYDLARICGAPWGTIYKVLKEMNGVGYVEGHQESEDAAAAEGRPVRKLYKVTGEGEAALAGWRAEKVLRSPSTRMFSLDRFDT